MAKRDAPSATAPEKRAKAAGFSLPTGAKREAYAEAYRAAAPYNHVVVKGAFEDGLLENVVEETRTYGVRGEEGSLPGWGWEQKETDIYRIQQTPDLASLDPAHLPDATLAALPHLTELKRHLYSHEFRRFVQDVTGCGPLSGVKADASVGLYTQGSHLLLHDDSISTRVISYILYLPNSPLSAPASAHTTPASTGTFAKGWDPKWGGALELYPVESGEERGAPAVKRVAKVDVTWGQIIFFEVKPGRSYHAVEEVVVDEGRQRLGVSGWFHRPIEGEAGYAPADALVAAQALSSLAQITAAPTAPFVGYTSDPPLGLTASDISYLSAYLAPAYLSQPTLEKLANQFGEASEAVLHNFLAPALAARVRAETEAADRRGFVRGRLAGHDAGEGDGWALRGPPSKQRYAVLAGESSATPALASVARLVTSDPFRAWLGVITSLLPLAHRVEARRFRPGLDYTLAAGEPAAKPGAQGGDAATNADAGGEARLDVVYHASWWADVPVHSDEEDELTKWGGWDCYLPAPPEEENPEVYQGRGRRVDAGPSEGGGGEVGGTDGGADDAEHADGVAEGYGEAQGGGGLEFDPDQFSPSDFDTDSEPDDDDDDDDDGPLLTVPVAFNRLLLVLRDPGVMRFVKYLGAGAGGSRWDVGGEWEVGVLEEDDEA
ncbi:putative component of NuA3 histone acetyltransferase complex [Cryptotrichosporon argae]